MKNQIYTEGAKRSRLLIALCWVVYASSYISKLNYAANINGIMSYYSVSHAEAGLVSTFFFFSYGIGQVINGIFCKKYNVKFTVILSLALSSVTNIVIPLVDYFPMIKFLWAFNGIALSLLWPCLIRFIAENVDDDYMSRASVIMGTTTATGTFFIYGISALLANFASFKVTFYIASATTVISMILWMTGYSGLRSEKTDADCNGKKSTDEVNSHPEETSLKSDAESSVFKKKMERGVLITVAILCAIGVATNFLKDGLTTWVPSILKEDFGLDNSLSIILTLSLPVLSIFGNLFALTIHKRIPNFVYQCGVIFASAAIVILLSLFTLEYKATVPAIVTFAVICFLISSCNSLITSIFPLFMKDKLNSGLIAGIVNGFCYVGSTLSTWGLGAIADSYGWKEGVFPALLAVALAVALIALIYAVCNVIATKKEKGGTLR